jgi:hypothetical protein
MGGGYTEDLMTSTIKATAVPAIGKTQFVDGQDIEAADFTTAFTEADTNDQTAAERVSVSAGDTHVKHLEDAVTAGTGIAITKTNAGADEALSVAVDAVDASLVDSGAATSGQVLQANGAGGAAWVTPAGGGGELGASSELTISSGAVTATGAHHTVDTEGDASTDDLETINGLSDGDMVLIVAEDAARTVVVKHGVGNIRLNGGVDFDLDNTEKGVLFIKSGTYVIGVGVPVTSGAGSGTVTSVGLSAPAMFTVTGSPVTSSGTLALGLASQTANQFLAAPDGSNGAPSFRAMVADDVPSLDASKIGSGQLGISRGGTGAATSSTARSNLGLAIGTDVQAHDALLDDIAAITPTKGDLLVTDGTDLLALGVGTNGQVLTADSAEASGVKWADAAGGGGVSVALLSYRLANGNAGAGFASGAWRTMVINSEDSDADGIVSLSANTMALGVGTYELSATMYMSTGATLKNVKIQFHDGSNSLGEAMVYIDVNTATSVTVHGLLTVSSGTTNVNLRGYTQTGSVNQPAVAPDGGDEVYTQVVVRKVG